MSDRERVRTTGIDHLHLNVYELDKAIELFTGLFDCKLNVPLYIDSIDGVNSMNSLGMDVIAPASPDGMYGKMMKKIGEGLSAVSFYVDDLDEARASTPLRRRSAGVEDHGAWRRCVAMWIGRRESVERL